MDLFVSVLHNYAIVITILRNKMYKRETLNETGKY